MFCGLRAIHLMTHATGGHTRVFYGRGRDLAFDGRFRRTPNF
jgi:hypothetical protein